MIYVILLHCDYIHNVFLDLLLCCLCLYGIMILGGDNMNDILIDLLTFVINIVNRLYKFLGKPIWYKDKVLKPLYKVFTKIVMG